MGHVQNSAKQFDFYLGEIPPQVRWNFIIPMVLHSSCKRKMKIQRILLEGGISPLRPGSGK